MFTVVQLGSAQYVVRANDTIEVNRLPAKEAHRITLKDVLLLSQDNEVLVGQPFLKNVEVSCLVLKHSRGKKQVSYKYRRRKSSHWKKGHRQELTSLLVEKIIVK